MTDINRPTQDRRIPSVLTKDEVAGLLAAMEGVTALLARLLYSTGMRLMAGMRLRVKDVDFDGFWGQSPNSSSLRLARWMH